MKTVIIPKSRYRDIHSVADPNFDREIKFPKGHLFAVVLASYYGGRGYTTHRTEEAAIRASNENSEYSHEIIGADGVRYDIEFGWEDTLRPDQSKEPFLADE